MPRFNETGPGGSGPGTGWGLGPCGIGSRRGFGRGFGRFWRFGSQVTEKEEKESLKEEAKSLEEELAAVKTRLAELKD
ncbi:MAG: cytoplasmic protein [Candidatus Nealsonbacteria bacterium CG09_land_8_20_14_0_10_42_14]|uniref:Cytoplasmic protein n=1 Tax=Candidatus Nealsonbacteria bacterium CG09_land_8_20_14_0_10_42_14 TaxID=1974707 RepID=A0A2H0WX28_9BACT|nr:MAG: cytoplasmic protein [Candidatus Nealsonbacteria bacterium CG09_land_8_20_14_0_10_42_14]